MVRFFRILIAGLVSLYASNASCEPPISMLHGEQGRATSVPTDSGDGGGQVALETGEMVLHPTILVSNDASDHDRLVVVASPTRELEKEPLFPDGMLESRRTELPSEAAREKSPFAEFLTASFPRYPDALLEIGRRGKVAHVRSLADHMGARRVENGVVTYGSDGKGAEARFSFEVNRIRQTWHFGRGESRTIRIDVFSGGGLRNVVLHLGDVWFLDEVGPFLVLKAPAVQVIDTGAASGAGHWELKRGLQPDSWQIALSGLGADEARPAAITGAWEASGRMVEARHACSEAFLPDGRLVVAGGSNGFNPGMRGTEIYDVDRGTWAPGPMLNLGRLGAIAVTLPTGQLMVSGGYSDQMNPNSLRSQVELLASDGSAWSIGPMMLTPRSAHKVALLPNGKALAFSGWPGITASEIFDPLTPGWTATGSQPAGHYVGASVGLRDGRVFAAGGTSGASASMYDPASGLWSSRSPMSTSRLAHTLTALPDGRVLAAAGQWSGTRLSSAEVYDPATNTWSGVSALGGPRSYHSSVLLPSGEPMVAAGDTANPVPGSETTSCETWDPALGSWSSAPALQVPRTFGKSVILPNGGALEFAGVLYDAATLATAEVLTVIKGSASATGSLSTARSDHRAVVLPDGRILAMGGRGGAGASLAGVEIFNPVSGLWSAQPSMSSVRQGFTATLLPSGKVLVVGGLGSGPIASCELYDPTTGTWSGTGSLTQARYYHAAVLLRSGKVMVGGGTNGTVLATTEIYDPESGIWSAGPLLGRPRMSQTFSILSDGSVFVSGGWEGTNNLYIKETEVIGPGVSSARRGPSLIDGRREHVAIELRDGRILIAGGLGSSDNDSIRSLASCEVYDPTTDQLSEASSLAAARQAAAAVRLGNGLVYVFGGAGSGGGAPLGSIEVFNPLSETWTTLSASVAARKGLTATELPDGRVLLAGGEGGSALAVAELFDREEYPESRRPQIGSVTSPAVFGGSLAVSGSLRGDAIAGDGANWGSIGNVPVLDLRSIEGNRDIRLRWDPRSNLSDDPMTLTVSDLPDDLDPGWYYLSVVVNGVPSVSKLVQVTCSVSIRTQPSNETVLEGESATFSLSADGARAYQWERCAAADCSPASSWWESIPGATSSSYTTPAVSGGDVGTRYRCTVTGACASSATRSASASLLIGDAVAPSASLTTPNGGEYWELSKAGDPAEIQPVVWQMSDNVRVCRVEAILRTSTDGGQSWSDVPTSMNLDPGNVSGGGSAVFGAGGACAYPGEATKSLAYTVPLTFPSGVSGSLYKVRLSVTDQAGNTTTVESSSPFYIVQSNPEATRTLILSNTSRMRTVQGISLPDATALETKLRELAAHPRVQGLVVDLAGITDVTALYGAWDSDPSNAEKANNVLFGCESSSQSGCSGVGIRLGVHDTVRSLLEIYTGVEHIVIVGDDRIVPMARVVDGATLLPESTYLGSNLTATGTTVGRALAANRYLSDDPLAVRDAVTTADLPSDLLIPDVGIGRLVESPADITTTIATFISQDGVLDLSLLNATTGHKVLITAYDFLTDSGKQIRKKWKQALGVNTPDNSLQPVDGSLLEGNWGLGSVGARATALRAHLGGNGGARYGVMSLNGHASHFEEGVPGTDPSNIVGLGSNEIYGPDGCGTPTSGALALAGGIAYSVGCHSALPVPGNCHSDSEHSLDLSQAFLSRGVVGYIGNTGYGWGLKWGRGYGEWLAELMTEELASGGTLSVGRALRTAKSRYVLEGQRLDAYDRKTLMQWTLFGLPMYALKTGIAGGLTTREPAREVAGPDGSVRESFGEVVVERGAAVTGDGMESESPSALPPYLTQLTLHFDFSAPGVYTKYKSDGTVETQPTGCSDPNGCYYSLNGLVERSGGETDQPIQPYFVYDSKLSGTSQHGVLWKGGVFREESGWVPIIGELASNGGDGSGHGSQPRVRFQVPVDPRIVIGKNPESCRASDLEESSLVVTAGEAFRNQLGDPQFDRERVYREIDIEMFYFNDTSNSLNNCDRTGPAIGAGPYHATTGMQVRWSIPVSDPAGVWRVVVAVNDGRLNGAGQGTWETVELADGNLDGIWTGNRTVTGSLRLTYLIQAVDRRGNVSWLLPNEGSVASREDGVTAPATLPSSGVPLGEPEAVDVGMSDTDSDGMADAWESETGLSVGSNDASLDPDSDGLSSLAEFLLGTLPLVQDTDEDGDNDGSESGHLRDAIVAGDGHEIQISVSEAGADVLVDWTADASSTSGPYYVYRGSSPLLSPSTLISTKPLPAPATSHLDTGAAGGATEYYWVTNVAMTNAAPVIYLVSPASGSVAGGTNVSLIGENFIAGSSVTFGGASATDVAWVNGNKLTCRTPAHLAGAVEVRVTSPNGQFGAVSGGFTFVP